MRLYNSLTRKKEEFTPLHLGVVSMYHCGPTVYDSAHIGNLRAYVFSDTLRRTFEYLGYGVRQVMNITDVGHLTSDADSGEDKMTMALKREGKSLTLESMKALGDFYTERFLQDLKALNILIPHDIPRASEHIGAQITLVKRLEEKGLVYRTSDGMYFDTNAYPEYGKFGTIHQGDDEHSRIGANKEKKNHRDFALWKFNPVLGWESPWGKGFPGWHIECSAMSMEALGESFDIHTGGIDHIGTHHTNEIAQSEAATGKPLARYWLHNGFLSINGEKMAKSKGNVTVLRDVTGKGIDPLAFRLWLLQAHYRSPVNFTWDAILGAEKALWKIYGHMFVFARAEEGLVIGSYRDRFSTFMEDDLDTPHAIALMWELLRDASQKDGDKWATLSLMDEVFGLKMRQASSKKQEVPEEIHFLAKEREEARTQKNWVRADKLRGEIKGKGFGVNDTAEGPVVFPLPYA